MIYVRHSGIILYTAQMCRLLLFILVLPLSACGQPAKSPEAKTDLVKIYSQAIGDFITAANKKNAAVFDTIFIAKRQNGQPDDFPEIELPGNINNTEIILITPELAKESQEERKTRMYINLIGWVEKETAEFMFVVFSNGFEHQYLKMKLSQTNKHRQLIIALVAPAWNYCVFCFERKASNKNIFGSR